VALGTAINLKSTVVVGGLDMMQQATALAERPHVVVATPGRLCDLIKSSSGNGSQWNLSKVKYLVLDEADRLLNPTFAEELGFLIKQLPQQRQTLLFTATITDAIMHLREKEPVAGKEKPFLHLTDQEYVQISGWYGRELMLWTQGYNAYYAGTALSLHIVPSPGMLRLLPATPSVRAHRREGSRQAKEVRKRRQVSQETAQRRS
jgi:ATP-dependent RNA helicase DDX49/DBP8